MNYVAKLLLFAAACLAGCSGTDASADKAPEPLLFAV